MKNLLLILLFLAGRFAFAQTMLPEPPPVNPGYGFDRHLYVDCADEIVQDIVNGDALSLESELENYIWTNYISGIALDGIRNISGNPAMEQGLIVLLGRLKNFYPRLYITIVVRTNDVNNLSFLEMNDPEFENCGPQGRELRLESSSCKNIDGLYVRFEKPSLVLSMFEARDIFNSYIDELKAAREFKCKNSCLKYVDADFDPFENYTLEGWTITDQLTAADPLIDRMIIPAFYNKINLLYENRCRVLHLLSDRFSKKGTNILIGLSAESARFRYCDKPGRAADCLGDYLTGYTSPSGNMASAEKAFLNKVNDRNYTCSWCNCNLYPSNHFDTDNLTANRITGSMWYYYSMMNSAHITKSVKNVTQEIMSESWYNLVGQKVKPEFDGLKLKVVKFGDGVIKRTLQN